MKKLFLLIVCILSVAVANAQEVVEQVIWDSNGDEITVAIEDIQEVRVTASGFYLVTTAEVQGWTGNLEREARDLMSRTTLWIPGQVGEAQFSDQCDRYNGGYNPYSQGFSSPRHDSTGCLRYAPEVPLSVVREIDVSSQYAEPNSTMAHSRRNLESKPEAERFIDIFNHTAQTDENSPTGIWGPGNTASFWWDDAAYQAFQLWGDEDYYIRNGWGDLWKVPQESIDMTDNRWEIYFPLNWVEEWVTNDMQVSIDYIPPRGENEYPDRHIYQEEQNIYAAQARWLERNGREGWKAIHDSLPEDRPLYDYQFSLSYYPDEQVLVVEDTNDILINGNEPDVVESGEDWFAYNFVLGQDVLQINDVVLNGNELNLPQAWFILGSVQRSAQTASSYTVYFDRVGPLWFDDETITVPVDGESLQLQFAIYNELVNDEESVSLAQKLVS